MRVLVTGGTRSGKSAHAEALLADRAVVTYVATGPEPTSHDPAWAARVAAHRERRPAHWRTSTDPLEPRTGAVLVDSLGTWLAGQLDDLDAWAGADWQPAYEARAAALLTALDAHPDVVVVTEEVGLGGIPGDPGARLFADLLGTLNQQVAARCDEVHLVVAGRVLRL